MKRLIGLSHRADGVQGYQLQDGTYVAILKAPVDSIRNVEIFYDDPYNWKPISNEAGAPWKWSCHFSAKFVSKETDGEYDYFRFELKSKELRFKYFFKFDNNGKTIAYGEFGYMEFISVTKFDYHSFSFTWNYSSIGKYVGPRDWWTKTSWYQIFPDRFFSTEKKLLEPKPDAHEILSGGTLNGIISKLDYIKDLGFNGVYLNPIFKASSNHKYDTIDYFDIDPAFGTMDDFENLVSELKKRGMRIMLDGVFNHCGWEHPMWLDVLKNKSNSKYKDYFVIWDIERVGTPAEMDKINFNFGGDKPFSTFGNTPTMPRLNWANSDMRKYIGDIISFWTSKGIDGWRMDVADEVSFDMWRYIRTVAKNINPDIALLGEIWYDALPFLHGDQFDTSMNYPFRLNALDYFVYEKISTEEFTNSIIRNKYMYSENINKGLFNLVGSHDVPRILELCKGDKIKSRLLLSYLLLSQGAVSFYYGDEIDLDGGMYKDNRQLFDWEFDTKNETYQLVKKLLEFRNKNIDLISGRVNVVCSDDDVKFIYDNKLIISINKAKGELILDGQKIEVK